jgi:hypothetical protein
MAEYNGQLDPRYYDQNQQGGGRVADRTPSLRKFYGIDCHETTQRWIASGVVAKAGTIMQCDNAGYLVPHRGFKEKAVVTFLDTLTSGKVVTIAGLTFTAGSSGCTVANLVKAWSSIPASTGYVAAASAALAAGITARMGTFTAGTLTNYLTDEITVGDISPNAVAFVYIGTDVDPANLTVITDNVASLTTVDIILALQNFQKIEGVLAVDVDNTSAAAYAPIFEEGTFFADDDGRSFLRWITATSGSVPDSEKVYNPITNTYVPCTAYNTGCYGTTEAAKRAKQRFVTGSEIDIYLFQTGANVGMEDLTNALVGSPT